MAKSLPSTEVRSVRFLLGTLLVLAVAGLFILQPFLSGTLFALAIGFLLQRPYRALARWVRWKPLAATLLVFGVVLLICLPLVFITWQLVTEVRTTLAEAGAGGYNAVVLGFLTSLGLPEDFARQAIEQGRERVAAFVQDHALDTLGKLGRFLANLGVFVFMLFFVLLSGPTMERMVQRALPMRAPARKRLLDAVGLRVRALFLGTFLVAIIQGAVATVGWWLLGYPAPLFWGFIMTLLAVIPAIGPALVMVPAGLLRLAQGDAFAGIALIVYGLVVVSLVDNLVRPFVVGRSSNVHPAIVLLGTLGGLAVFGVTGFILGPLVLSMIGPIFDEWERIREEPGDA